MVNGATRWLNGNLTRILTVALGMLLFTAATGTWKATVEFQRLQERIEQRGQKYEQRFESHENQMENLRSRVQWLEQNRTTKLTIWDLP